jgi:phosphate transport system substrate-binding protein
MGDIHPTLRLSRRALLGLVACAGTAAACRRVETPRVTPIPVRIRIAADGATMPLMRALVQAFQARHPEWEFSFELAVGQAVHTACQSGAADIAASAEAQDDSTARLWFTDLAADGVALIVNTVNTLADVTLSQLREIFAGFRNEWTYFGAQNAGSIQVVVRESPEPTRMLFDRVVMGDVASTSSAVVLPTDDTVLNFVALNPGAVAYLPGGLVATSAPPSIKLLAVEGQSLRAETLATGRYPLVRNTYLFARSEPQGMIREFAAWIRSPDAAPTMRALGYAPP